MTSNEIREKYLKFFEDRGHAKIPPSPLVLKDDPTTLFTSSGMQQLVPYLKGEKPHPEGNRLVDSQPSFRAVDIDEVGDSSHLTFFEMLGNWSLGDYFKAEQLPWIWEFYTKELGLSVEKLWISVFEGTKDVPKDGDSIEVWRSLGIPEERIREYGVEKNWWSRSGTPNEMPRGEIGGPDSEVFYEFDIPHNPDYGDQCHPNCQCGKFLEIGNSVFIQYRKNEDGTLSELPQKNVDFGGGLERIAAAVNNDPDVFKIDIYKESVAKIESFSDKSYEENKKAMRIIADHIRAANALAEAGVVPSNKLQGYILRRLIRKAAVQLSRLTSGTKEIDFRPISDNKVILEEVDKFKKALGRGLKEIEKIEKIDGKKAFDLYQSYGFPIDLTIELFKEKGQEINKEEFEKEFEKHQELSRASSASMFKAK